MNSILKALKEQVSATQENFDVNLTINEFTSVYKKLERMDTVIEYTVETLPIWHIPVNGKMKYCIEMDILDKYMDCNRIDVTKAIQDIFDSIYSQDMDITKSDMAVIIPDENMDFIMREIKRDACTMSAKCEFVSNYTNKLKAIQNEGVQIVLK